MKYLLCISIVIAGLVSVQKAFAQQQNEDTVLMVMMDRVDVTADRKWDNDTVRYQYNQTKHYIQTILPYLREATRLFTELDAKVNDPDVGRKERRRFVNSKEDELRDKFETEVKKLNETQGVLLVKLIGRQTGVNIYSMLNEFKNPFTAIRWQAWAKLNGFNLNRKYDPNDEPMLEHIMENMGYPLPPYYNDATAKCQP